ncbi:MAG: hypothetical protein C0623_13750 [Desulfuromonas sp.]|nr:MAG: hypothetical protein C0623_13750 [Desulfuromonas sp.]
MGPHPFFIRNIFSACGTDLQQEFSLNVSSKNSGLLQCRLFKHCAKTSKSYLSLTLLFNYSKLLASLNCRVPATKSKNGNAGKVI